MMALALMLIPFFASASHLEDVSTMAKSVATHSLGSIHLDPSLQEELKPDDAEKFDAKQAKNDVLTGVSVDKIGQQSVDLSMINVEGDLDSNDPMFFHSDEITNNPDLFVSQADQRSGSSEYYDYICMEAGDPFILNYKEYLEVQVEDKPAIISHVKICKGHKRSKKVSKKKEAYKLEKKWDREFTDNPFIESYNIKISGGGSFSRYKVKANWTHIEESPECSSTHLDQRNLKEPYRVIQEKWIGPDLDTLKLAQSEKCTLLSVENSKSGMQEIQGHKLERPCWEKTFKYQCYYNSPPRHAFFSSHNCFILNKTCKQETSKGCSLWETTYRCKSKIDGSKNKLDGEIFGLDDSIYEGEYDSSESFQDAISTLAVFEAIDKELKDKDVYDPHKVEIFSGKKMKCSRCIADSLTYDCCFSMKGLANDLNLSHCTADELALADHRDKGLCHYIGSYDKKTVGVKTKTVRVFCSFHSKLSRVLHEQGRKQLGIGWGTPKKPLCRGFKLEEIQEIDFSKIDMSEAFESPDIQNYEKKLSEVEERLKEKFERL